MVKSKRLEFFNPFCFQATTDDEDDHEQPLHKRCKTSPPPLHDQASVGINEFGISPSMYDPLEEPSPLGLRLRKSPSLLNLIQMRLLEENTSSNGASLSGNPKTLTKKELCGNALLIHDSPKRDPKNSNKNKNKVTAHSIDKMKASNFPASLLRIGGWKYESRHEGDIIAKFYYSKHKLVWEVLDNSLKKKIEIQWSDIIALKAFCPDKGPGTLAIVLGSKPLFFTETNPQPRRQILWHATTDFTDGHAITYRKHYLQCPEGVLNKHYEKLIQCDSRLKLLSQQPDTDLHSLYFVTQPNDFRNQEELRDLGFSHLISAKRYPMSDILSPSPSQSSSSVISSLGNGDGEAYDFHGPRSWLNEPEIPPSELFNHANYMGHNIQEQRASWNQSLAEDSMFNELRDIAETLLGDSEMTTAQSDEQALMKRVDSLCYLLQGQPEKAIDNRDIDVYKSQLNILSGDAQLIETSGEKSHMMRVNSLCCLLQAVDGQRGQFQEHYNVTRNLGHNLNCNSILMPENLTADSITAYAREGSLQNVSSSSKAPVMSRKDSLADLFLSLPKVASIPKFLFEISEDDKIMNF